MKWLRSSWKGLTAFVPDVLGAREEKNPEGKDTKPTESPAQALSADMEAIRAHLKLLGATLSAGATALLLGLGWAQLHNVFPAPAHNRATVMILAFLGAAAALIGIGGLIGIIFAAQRRIPIASDTASLGFLGNLKDRELRIRDAVFRSVAVEQEEASLRDVEMRARRREREADQATDAAVKERLKAESARLDTAVAVGITGAALLILEERSGSVFRGWWARIAFVLGALGIVLLFGVADYSKGQRDLIALRKSCAEAAAAGVKDPCKSVVDFESGSGSSGVVSSTNELTAITIGVPRPRPSCIVSVRVNGKATRATRAGMAKITINDYSRLCGVRLDGGGMALRSPGRHTGTTTATVQLKPLSYSVMTLQVPPSSTTTDREARLEPLVAGP